MGNVCRRTTFGSEPRRCSFDPGLIDGEWATGRGTRCGSFRGEPADRQLAISTTPRSRPCRGRDTRWDPEAHCGAVNEDEWPE